MQQLLSILSDDPVLRMVQVGLLVLGCVAVYLVCYTTRDILLRTRSFLYQAGSILLVALLPVVGFFLYLLIRPARTIKQREIGASIGRILTLLEESEILAMGDEESFAAVLPAPPVPPLPSADAEPVLPSEATSPTSYSLSPNP